MKALVDADARQLAIPAICGALLLGVGLLVVAPCAVYAAGGSHVPHGGYSLAPTSDACLQCHDIHEASSDVLLLRERTVSATCGTCHTLYLEGPSGVYDPGYSGSEAGTAAGLRAYAVALPLARVHDGHRLSLASEQIEYSDGVTDAADYIPWGNARLALVSSPGLSSLETSTTAGLYCGSCHAVHGTFAVSQPLSSSFSSALLRSNPNAEQEVSVEEWGVDGGVWCSVCHDGCAPGGADSFHAAQAIGDCVSSGCHDQSASDWPHSGSPELVPEP